VHALRRRDDATAVLTAVRRLACAPLDGVHRRRGRLLARVIQGEAVTGA
jgi:hypothetical protein